MLAFHNDNEIKEKYVNRVLAHQKSDEIIKGKYWEKGKGCAVGCTIHGSNHLAYEIELGIPMWLAKLEDRTFERLPLKRDKKWPAEFLIAITPGQDLSKIKIPLLIFIVESARSNFNHDKYPKQLAAIDMVLFELKRDIINYDSLRKARSAADAAADADTYAAYAAADAAATRETYTYYVKLADKILELIKEYK